MIRNLLTSPRPGGPPPGVFGAGLVNDVGFVNGGKTGPAWQNNPGLTGSNSDPTAGQGTSSVFANNNGSTVGSNNLPTPSTVQNTQSNFNTSISGGAGVSGSNSAGAAGQTIGGGIAGIASKAERPGIKIYKDHQKYNEWEFIYDYAKDTTQGGGQQQIPPTQPNGPAGQNGLPGGQGAAGGGTNPQGTPQGNGQFGNQPGTTSTGAVTGGTANGQTTTPAFPVIPPSN